MDESIYVTAAQLGEKAGRHKVFFLAAARIGLLVAKKQRPMVFLKSEADEFLAQLGAQEIRMINDCLKGRKSSAPSGM